MPNNARITIRHSAIPRIPSQIATAEPVLDSSGMLFVGINNQPTILGAKSGLTRPAFERIEQGELVAAYLDRSQSVFRLADWQDGFFCLGWALHGADPGQPLTILTAKGTVVDVNLPDGIYYLGLQGVLTISPPPTRVQLIGQVCNNRLIFSPSTAITALPAPAVGGITVPVTIAAGITRNEDNLGVWSPPAYYNTEVLVFQYTDQAIVLKVELEPSSVAVVFDLHLHGTALRDFHYSLENLPPGTILIPQVDGSTIATLTIPAGIQKWELRVRPSTFLEATDPFVTLIATITAVVTSGYRPSNIHSQAIAKIGSGQPASTVREILVRDIQVSTPIYLTWQEVVRLTEARPDNQLRLVAASSGAPNRVDLIRVRSTFI